MFFNLICTTGPVFVDRLVKISGDVWLGLSPKSLCREYSQWCDLLAQGFGCCWIHELRARLQILWQDSIDVMSTQKEELSRSSFHIYIRSWTLKKAAGHCFLCHSNSVTLGIKGREDLGASAVLLVLLNMHIFLWAYYNIYNFFGNTLL